MLDVRRDGNEHIAESYFGELESLPTQVGRERIGDFDDLGRGGRIGLILEGDFIIKQVALDHEILDPKTRRTVELVWITRSHRLTGAAGDRFGWRRIRILAVFILDCLVINLLPIVSCIIINAPRSEEHTSEL